MGGSAGGAHVPGSMGGGAHLPSSMGSGAHVPSSMAGAAHVPSSVSAAHTPTSMPHVQRMPAATPHTAANTGRTPYQSHVQPAGARTPAVNTADHGGGAHPATERAASAHPEASHAPGESRPATTHGMVAHRAGTDTVMRGAHGRLVLASAGGGAIAHAPRPYIHPGLRANSPRKPDEVSHDREFVHAHEHDFHTSRVRDFTPREMAAWRHGLWRDEWHYGRRGWWYEDDGVWYPYADPEYPYPLEVAPLVVYDNTVVADGDEVPPEEPVPVPVAEAGQPGAPVAGVAVSGTAVATIAPLPAPPPGWYRCGEPAGYYPSVGACSGPWILEPDASPGGPPPGSQ